MLFREMFIVGSTYWNMVYGKDVGDVLEDKEGMDNMRNIGQNMAWLFNHTVILENFINSYGNPISSEYLRISIFSSSFISS